MSLYKSLAVLPMTAGALLVGVVDVVLAQNDDSMTLTVVARATTDVVTDTGEKGDTVGDVLTFANEVYDEKNENIIGTDQGFLHPNRSGESLGMHLDADVDGWTDNH